MITGATLQEWGFRPGPWYKEMLSIARRQDEAGVSPESIKAQIASLYPPEPVIQSLQSIDSLPIFYNIDVESDFDKDNLAKVKAHIEALGRTPTLRGLAVMPDACPSGQALGTIPVGGVAVAENAIHPGFHSADVCCSMAASFFPSDADPTAILDAGMALSHFGPGGRDYSHDMRPPQALLDSFEKNQFLKNTSGMATKFFGTQGDGNHFFYVGRLQSTGQIVLVTHHGSRKPGAELYKRGMAAAKEYCKQAAPDVPQHNAWIPFDSDEGQDYWEALGLIRQWTKKNHFAIHDTIAKNLGLKLANRYWNEHNFVFHRRHKNDDKDYFYHAKGATPAYGFFAEDAYSGLTLIPLNMAEPILVSAVGDAMRGTDFDHPGFGFAPHGAGRNFSRTDFGRFLKSNGISAKDMIADIKSRFDVRAFSGKYDISEFPAAYKNAEQIARSINKHDLCQIVDKIEPIGSIMAGHTGWSRRTDLTIEGDE